MQRLFSIFILLTLAACASIANKPQPEDAIDGASLQLGAPEFQAWPDDHWWQRYGDPQLDFLVDQALVGNPDLEIAQARLARAQAAAQGARALSLPQLNALADLQRERYSSNYIYPPPTGGSWQTDARLQLQFGLDLDLWGKQKHLAAAARLRASAAGASAQQSRILLASTVSQAYFQLQNALAQAKAIDAITAKLRQAQDITRELYANGIGTQIDVNQADSALAAARVQLAQAQQNAQLLHNRLAALLGLAPAQLPRLSLQENDRLPTELPASIPLELLARRADIVAAREQALAAGAQQDAAKADFMPNINLQAAAGLLSLGLNNLLHAPSADYGAGPVISLPIFDAGARKARYAESQAASAEAIALYRQTVLAAVREVADSLDSIRSLRVQLGHQEDSLRAIEAAYEVALKRYASGLGNFLQVLMAQNEALRQTVNMTDLRAQAYVLDARLQAALGGGFQAPDTTIPQ